MATPFEEIKMPESVVWKVTGRWSSDLTYSSGSNLYKLEPGYTYQVQAVNLTDSEISLYRAQGGNKSTRQALNASRILPGQAMFIPSVPVPQGEDIRIYFSAHQPWGSVGDLIEAKLFAFPIVKE